MIVGHAQNVRLIAKSRRKDDRLDARTLARLARIDPELSSPVKHRSAQAQLHLTEIRARAVLVSARTALMNAARGLVKSYGERLHKCGTQQFCRETTSGLSTGLREALEPLLREVESLNERIQEYDRRIAKMDKQTYPETALLPQVKGVGDSCAVVSRSATCKLMEGATQFRLPDHTGGARQVLLYAFTVLYWPARSSSCALARIHGVNSRPHVRRDPRRHW